MRVSTKLWKRIETLKKEKEGLLTELENLEKMAEAKASELENEVTTLRREVKALETLLDVKESNKE